MAEPVVRVARDAEIDQLGTLWGEMYDYQRAHGMTLPLRPDAIDIWKKQLVGRLDSQVSVIFVAEHAGELVGFLAAQTKRLPPHLSTDKPKVGFISEVFVRPAVRRHHLGKALVDAAFAWFAKADVGSIELHVLVENPDARAFWARLGFVEELVQMRRS